jgi:hypothetical protein
MTNTTRPLTSKCKSCKRTIEWAVTEQRKFIPLDPGETPGSNLVISGEAKGMGRHGRPLRQARDGNRTTHFATCKFADE